MKKYFLIIFIFCQTSYADLEIGSDFEAGDLISAEIFNAKFNAINGVLGEIVDADLLGNWECVSYMSSLGFVPESYLIANGGNGQVGSGKFFSTNATLNLSETDNDSSINSPKSWTISKDDVVNSNGFLSGVYTLIGDIIFFHNDSTNINDEDELLDSTFSINRLSPSKLALVDKEIYRKVVICELTSS
mgnify:CR=1 FL=1